MHFYGGVDKVDSKNTTHESSLLPESTKAIYIHVADEFFRPH